MNDSKYLKLKILVCESDTKILKQLESWIKTIIEEVYISDNAIQAYKIFDKVKPDIILVSQNLNNIDTIEFIEDIKKKVPTQAVILMLNVDSSSTIFKRSIDLKVDKYLNTPIESSSLLNTIDELSKEKIRYKDYLIQKKLLQDYNNAIDSSFSISKHDENGKIFYVNDLFCKTTKLSYDDAMNGDINPFENQNSNISKMWSELNKNNIYRDRQIFKLNNQKEHIIDITAVCIKNDKTNVNEYLVFSNDVTDIVRSARKIKQQETDKKLQKLEHLKELDKIKDNILTVFSHELKTPLNSIINFSEYIKKHLLKENFKKRDILVEQISQINLSGWFMLDMISNMIDSMKFRNDSIELLKAKFSINDVIENILTKYDDKTKNIKVIKLFKDECIIFSDEKRVEQLLNNLISNAIKYCKKKIGIIIKSNEEDFILEILDDGDGFTDTSKVFELFEQSNEDAMTRTANGMGMGLFIAKKICDTMKYDISISNSKLLGGARVLIKGKKDIK